MKTGIVSGLSMREYLALDRLSSGMCRDLLVTSPYHVKWARDNRIDDANDASDTGTAMHDALLEGLDRIVAIDAPDWRTKAAKEARDMARLDGRIPMLAHKVKNIEAAVSAAKEFIAKSEIAGIFDTGEAEATLCWVETLDDGEVLCKCRPDHLSGDRRICLSYKTTAGSANPDAWIRTQLPSYDVATAFYARGVLAVCPEVEGARVVHLVQSQSAPYACSLVALSPAWEALAEQKLDRALVIWADCQATGIYPAFPSRICYAEPKSWQFQEFDEAVANGDQLTNEELKDGVPL